MNIILSVKVTVPSLSVAATSMAILYATTTLAIAANAILVVNAIPATLVTWLLVNVFNTTAVLWIPLVPSTKYGAIARALVTKLTAVEWNTIPASMKIVQLTANPAVIVCLATHEIGNKEGNA